VTIGCTQTGLDVAAHRPLVIPYASFALGPDAPLPATTRSPIDFGKGLEMKFHDRTRQVEHGRTSAESDPDCCRATNSSAATTHRPDMGIVFRQHPVSSSLQGPLQDPSCSFFARCDRTVQSPVIENSTSSSPTLQPLIKCANHQV
jgi:hypothetical protein